MFGTERRKHYDQIPLEILLHNGRYDYLHLKNGAIPLFYNWRFNMPLNFTLEDLGHFFDVNKDIWSFWLLLTFCSVSSQNNTPTKPNSSTTFLLKSRLEHNSYDINKIINKWIILINSYETFHSELSGHAKDD